MKLIIEKTIAIRNMKRILLVVYLLSLTIGFAQKEVSIMPWPKSIETTSSKYGIDTSFHINVEGEVNDRIYKASTRFLRRLNDYTGAFIEQGYVNSTSNSTNPSLIITTKQVGELGIDMDESYELIVDANRIKINSNTDIGALRGLETLLQLVRYNEKSFYFTGVHIRDAPRFAWRGLMIDVARHYQPMDVLKRNLDAMAAVKMNVFHWHLTDDQGFRLESKKHPKLHELGSHGQFYTHEQIREIIQYALDRGIRVIPEIDVPGHASAILVAYPELASKEKMYTVEKYAGVFHPTLDPTNEKTYMVLEDLFSEIAMLFPDEYVHIGGDENEGKHWDENIKIQKFKERKGLKSNHDLQTHFNIRMQKILHKYHKKMIGWEEIISPQIEKSAIIHSWRGAHEGLPDGQSLINAVKLGYHTILSNGYYIDRMLPVEEHYLVDPIPVTSTLTREQEALILGGEATMWSELVTPLTIDSRIWPRTAAIAERFWSQKNIIDVEDMQRRLHKVNKCLEALGITHIRNRDVILRNITKSNNIEAISVLTRVCEPLKVYSRNAGGTEYQSYAPFTLFADACTADAADAKIFNKLVEQCITDPGNKRIKTQLQYYLQRWSVLYNNLKDFDNPIINEIKPIAKQLSEISYILNYFLKNNKLTSTQEEILKTTIQETKTPVADVELVVVSAFEKLIIHLKNQKKHTSN